MDNLVELYDLKKHFPIKGGLFRKVIGQVRAVDGISAVIPRGKTYGLVGESGCGKTTAGRTLVGLYKPTEGEIFFDVKPDIIREILDVKKRYESETDKKSQKAVELKHDLDKLKGIHDIYSLSKKELNRKRRNMQMVFQDPYGSLNPRIPIGDIIAEGPDIHGLYSSEKERKEEVQLLMDKTRIDPAYINRYAHEFSGGQRQRIGIARAIAMKPQMVVLDEPVSALDVSIQVQILDLLNNLKEEFGLTYMFIAHDLSVVEYFCDLVGVMYLGKIVETADRNSLYEDKFHPYTQALISAVPIPDPKKKKEAIILEGDVPSPVAPPSGCRFHPRCPQCMDICRREEPGLFEPKEGHTVSCWLYRDTKRVG